jgi:hypothetical protein
MTADDIEDYVARLKALPYVQSARLAMARSPEMDSALKIRTPAGDFTLAVEWKRSYLDRTLTNAILALAERRSTPPVIVLARYISRPTGERLAAAGINFVDQAGNLHLRIGDRYQTLLLGRPEGRGTPEGRRTSPAAVQVYLAFLADPEAMQWPTRRIAAISGAGKTAVADARQRLVAEGVLRPSPNGAYLLADRKTLEEYFIQGYEHVLRPHLTLGRYRSAERDPERFVEQVATFASKHGLPWALTGGAGAYELDRFYRGEETQLFLGTRALSDALRRDLKLLPDQRGLITCLRLFGNIVSYAGATERPVAHPWLVFAELLYQGEPRALEAAQEIREKFLAK